MQLIVLHRGAGNFARSRLLAGLAAASQAAALRQYFGCDYATLRGGQSWPQPAISRLFR